VQYPDQVEVDLVEKHLISHTWACMLVISSALCCSAVGSPTLRHPQTTRKSTILGFMESKTIRFIRRGELVSLNNVPPERTLLEVLREDLGCTGTKEGCGEGDCGACTVVLGEADGERIRYRAINSCIRLAHSVDGLALWTVEDLAGDDGTLHPAQEAMVQ